MIWRGMMKKRRVVYSFLMIVLIFVLSSSTFAVYTDIEDNPHSDAILEMSRLEILSGVGDGLFDPDGELNRAAAAKVAGYLLGYTEEDATMAAELSSLFNDVEGTPHAWAKGWINLMAEDNILRGVGDNQYAPGDSLQMVHWVAILTRILQHESEGMSWPDGYNDMANSLTLDQGLYYSGSKTMNRGEMARMTTTALYNVMRPDDKRIIDVVTFAEEPLDTWAVPEPSEPLTYNDADLSLSLDNPVVPLGGGEKITLTVKATDGESNLPASNAQIGFFVNAGQEDHTSQLSTTQGITDNNGIAKVTYTTISGDDQKELIFTANIFTKDEWLDRSISALVSDTAAFISGRVINPFNGEVPSAIEVGIMQGDDHSSYMSLPVASDGSFTSPVKAGKYGLTIEMNVAGTTPYTGAYNGSHFNVKENGDVRISIQNLSFNTGESYTIASEMGVITGSRNLPSGSEIYIMQKTDQGAQIAVISDNGRFMITLTPGTYVIYNNVGRTLKDNIIIEKGSVTDVGSF